jgi:hypothetical protein
MILNKAETEAEAEAQAEAQAESIKLPLVYSRILSIVQCL